MADPKLVTDILTKINQIQDPEALKTIISTARGRKESLAQVETASWKVGDSVQLLPEHQGRKPYDTIGTIKKINPKRIKVNFGAFGGWNVPKSMLEKVD